MVDSTASSAKVQSPLLAALAKAKQAGQRKPQQATNPKELKSTLFKELAAETAKEQKEKLDPVAALAKFTFKEQVETFENPTALRKALEAQIQILESSFTEDLDTIHDNLINIEKFIREHKELRDILMPDDIAIMVQACRITYGKTIQKRNANKKTKSAKKQQEDEIMNLLNMGDF